MRKGIAVGGVLALAFVGSAGAAVAAVGPELAPKPKQELAPLTTHDANGIKGSYIVKVDDGRDPAAVAKDLGVKPTHVYEHALNGFAAKLSPSQLREVRETGAIESVSQNAKVKVGKLGTKAVDSWGLDRIDQEALPLDDTYEPANTGEGVTAYVLDTGLDVEHPEFEGRAEIGTDVTGGDGHDGYGHGTHVSGTIAGTTYGVAKKANVVGVKVLDDSGQGDTAGIVEGIDWVIANAKKPAVANMSLGGPKDPALDEASDKLADEGIFLAVAAGNSGGDACQLSPAGAEKVFTVAASDKEDNSADFTEGGECVEVYAPGVEITSSIPGGGNQASDGTSMASPHVAGVAALYKQANGDVDSAALSQALQDSASKDVIQNAPEGTPANLLFTNGL